MQIWHKKKQTNKINKKQKQKQKQNKTFRALLCAGNFGVCLVSYFYRLKFHNYSNLPSFCNWWLHCASVCVCGEWGGWVGVWSVLSFQCVSRCRVKVCDCVWHNVLFNFVYNLRRGHLQVLKWLMLLIYTINSYQTCSYKHTATTHRNNSKHIHMHKMLTYAQVDITQKFVVLRFS